MVYEPTKRRDSRSAPLLGIVCAAALVAGCSSDSQESSDTARTETTVTAAGNDEIQRPSGPGSEIVATPELPSRAQGVTVLVYDAVGGDQVSFSAESGSGADAVVDEWFGLPLGALVEWNGYVIEVSEIQSESTVVFTLWEL